MRGLLTTSLLLFLGCVLVADGGSLAPLVGDIATLHGAAEAFTKTLQEKQQGIFKVTDVGLQTVQVYTARFLRLTDCKSALHPGTSSLKLIGVCKVHACPMFFFES
jgi:hypothetical protein